jgi:hypothetical protein
MDGNIEDQTCCKEMGDKWLSQQPVVTTRNINIKCYTTDRKFPRPKLPWNMRKVNSATVLSENNV